MEISIEEIKPIYAVLSLNTHTMMNVYKTKLEAVRRNKTRMKYHGYKLVKYTPSEVISWQEQ